MDPLEGKGVDVEKRGVILDIWGVKEIPIATWILLS